jgi:ubiquinone biosynthesis protein UbiJ
MLSSTFSAAINHLLTQEPWARARLAKHAGKVARIDAGLFDIRLKIAGDGMLLAAPAEEMAGVTIRVKLGELPLIMQNRAHAFSYVKVEGDADFANTISHLSQTLQWEVEADLSRWLGDVAAARLAAGVRASLETVESTGKSLAENLAEYLLDENPMLTRPQAVADFTGDVNKLRDDVERLAKRIEKLK